MLSRWRGRIGCAAVACGLLGGGLAQSEVASSDPASGAGPAESGALATAQQYHADSVLRPGWRPLRLRSGERVEEYLTDHVARVDRGPGRHSAVVRSILPLRTDDEKGVKRPVDLELESGPAGFEPANPLISLRLPRRADDAVVLGDIGLRLRLDGARDAAPADVGDKVFFSDVLPDTDVAMAPLPGGVQLFAQLRSAAAPRSIALAASLPGGTRLRGGRSGGLEIRRGERTLARIAPPVAWDADRKPVGVRYARRGDRFDVLVDHRRAGVKYPVVVDPAVVEDFRSWRTNANLDFNGWNYENDPANAIKPYYPSWYLGRGLYMYNRTTAQSYTGNEHRRWHFNALGFGDAYIFRADFTDMVHTAASSCTTEGIFSRRNNAYEPGAYAEQCFSFGDYRTYRTCTRSDCQPIDASGNPAGTAGNAAMFGVRMTGPAVGSQFTGYLGGAAIYQFDTVKPLMTASGLPTSWVDNASGMKVRGTDSGLGMRTVTLSSPTKSDWDQNRVKEPAPGCYDRNNRCAKIVETDAFTTGNLPEGAGSIRATGLDVIGDTAFADFPIKIDRTPPRIGTPSGQLWDARERTDDNRFEGLDRDGYTLRATATDTLSGVAEMEVFVDGASQRSRGGYATGGELTWTLKPDDYADGPHEVKIVARDAVAGQAGAPDERHVASTTIPVVVDRRGDVLRDELHEADPATVDGEVLAEEGIQLNTLNGRSDEAETLTTRDTLDCNGTPCSEVRYRTLDGYDDPNAADDYGRERGTSTTDPRLEIATETQQVRSEVSGQPAESGPIASAMQAWQSPPPRASDTYERYRATETDKTEENEQIVEDIWIDAGTRLPLRKRVTVGTETESDTFFTYNHPAVDRSELPADYFRLQPPSKVDQREEVDHTGEPQPAPARRSGPQATADQERELARTYRRSHGLSTDEALIERSLTDPAFADGRNKYGVGLSPAEVTKMDAAIVVQRGLDAYVDAADDDPGYAGVWMDAADPGRVVFAFTTIDPARDARLTALVESRGGTARFETHKFALAYLETVRKQVEDNLVKTETELGVKIGLVDAEESRDAVEVAVAQPDPALELQFRVRFGPAVNLVRDGGPARFRAARKVIGGSALARRGGGFDCTAAFSTRKTRLRNGRRRPFYRTLTAGHCGPKNSRWDFDNGFGRLKLGRMDRNAFPERDASRIRLSEARRSFRVRIRVGAYGRLASVATQASLKRDTEVCNAGFVTVLAVYKRAVCGRIGRTDYCQPARFEGTSREYRICGMWESPNMPSQGGDSGGPIVSPPAGRVAQGVLSAGIGNQTFFHPVGVAKAAVGDPAVITSRNPR
jgi:hypothetical protein